MPNLKKVKEKIPVSWCLKHQAGFTSLFLIILLAVLGLVALYLIKPEIFPTSGVLSVQTAPVVYPTYRDLNINESTTYTTSNGTSHTITLKSQSLTQMVVAVDGTNLTFSLTNGSVSKDLGWPKPPQQTPPQTHNGVTILPEVPQAISARDDEGRFARLNLTKAGRIFIHDDSRAMPHGVVPYVSTLPVTTTLRQGFLQNATYGLHYGVDFALNEGTPLQAVVSGTTVRSIDTNPDGLEGVMIVIEDSKYLYRYMHLSRIPSGLAVGQAVQKGQIIGYSGSTGSSYPHLHFSMIAKSITTANIVSDINPWPFIEVWASESTTPTSQPTSSPTPAPTSNSSAAPASSTSQWQVTEDSPYSLTAENSIYKVKFAYGGKRDGFFNAMPTTGCSVTTIGTAGGGCDGSIIELYYKPTDPTRNLVYRNGTYGSGYDAMDHWEAESTADGTQGSSDQPDWKSQRQGTPQLVESTKKVKFSESAGRLFVTFNFNFKAWNITKTYILYPTGKITISSDVKVINEGYYHYLGHRFNFAGSKYSFLKGGTTTYTWGGNYEGDLEKMISGTDGVDRYNPTIKNPPRLVSFDIVQGRNNTVAHGHAQHDTYTGFLIDTLNSNDPDILVISGDKDDSVGPFNKIAQKVEQNPLSQIHEYYSVVESAVYSFASTPLNVSGVGTEMQAGQTWFYWTSRSYLNQGYWDTDLGTWRETFHVYLSPASNYNPNGYLDQWREAANKIDQQTPYSITGATSTIPTLDPTDKLYHLTAASGSNQVKFKWKRATTANKSINYQTSFIVTGLENPSVQVVNDTTGAIQSNVASYHSTSDDTTLITFNFAQPTSTDIYSVTVSEAGSATPTPDPTDTTAPTVSFTAPKDGGTVRRWTTIDLTVTATDNRQIARVEFVADGVKVSTQRCTNSGSSYSCKWWVGGRVGDVHIVTAKAYDVNGNMTQKTIKFTALPNQPRTATPRPRSS